MVSKSNENERNRLETLAEEFVMRKSRGESPDIEQFASENPTLADDIRELFPVMELLNRAKSPSTSNIDGLSAEIGPGTRLGEYQLVRRIGRGGMGVVFQAEHITLGSQVAIKLLPAALDRVKLRDRFQREASAAARMHHPNIVRVFDFGSHEETLYYVMTLVNGWGLNRMIGDSSLNPEQKLKQSLALNEKQFQADGNRTSTVHALDPTLEFQAANPASSNPSEINNSTASLSDRTRFSSSLNSTQSSLWQWVTRIGILAADALEYAHSMGIVHRDIKPSNLMLDAEETVYVLDFGLAKVAGDFDLTVTGDVLGTLRYMPPEAFQGRADHRSDVYGLGLTLYELLANRSAYEDVDRPKLVAAITEGKLTRLDKLLLKIPRDLETIVHKSIAAEPAERYQTAGELRDDLKRFLNGQPVLARRATWIYQAARWIGRNRVVSALASGLILLLTVAAIASTISANRFEKLANEKEAERVTARKAEADSVAKTREAQLNLLAASISDARGWSTSRQPGQRVEGTKSLRESIKLARELGVLDKHRYELNEIAVTLSTLCDLPPGKVWHHPNQVADYGPLAFNSDLSLYAHQEYHEPPWNCTVYRLGDGPPEVVETIAVEHRFKEFTLQFSPDSRVLIGEMWQPGERSVPWIHDRSTGHTIRPEFELSGKRLQGTMGFISSKTVVFLTTERQLVGFNVESRSVEFQLALPTSNKWSHLAVSKDCKKIAIFEFGKSSLLLVDVDSRRFVVRETSEAGFHRVAWRPDGAQLAIVRGDDTIGIWDVQREFYCNTIRYTHEKTSHVAYNQDGRLLLSSGWDGATVVHNPLSERQVIRYEDSMTCVSENGRNVILHSGSRFEIRSIISAPTLSEYYVGRRTREVACVSAETGTIWSTRANFLFAIDFVRNRVLHYKNVRIFETSLTLDPLGRDLFLSYDQTVQRYPIHYDNRIGFEKPMKKWSKQVRFGPPELICRAGESGKFVPERVTLDSYGRKLAINSRTSHCEVVMDRNSDWKVSAHRHADEQPIRVVAHPDLPLVATTVHHGTQAEVRNVVTDEIVFRKNYKQCMMTFSPDGTRLLVRGKGKLQVYQVGSWRLLNETGPELILKKRVPCCISSDSKWIAVELQQPGGIAILNADTLKPTLMLRCDPDHPKSTVGDFDSSGRLLVADRGLDVVGLWDLYELRQYFESLDLEWPLEGLGNPTPTRDPAIPVRIKWNRSTPITNVVQFLVGKPVDALVELIAKFRSWQP